MIEPDKSGISVLREFQPLRLSVGTQVASRLRTAILVGQLKPGQRLVERRLAQTMQVSQGAVREALLALQQEGLLTKKPNTATYVTELSGQEITEMLDLRIDLESKLFVLGQRALNREKIVELEGLINEIDQGVRRNDYRHAYQSDLRFHQAVWEMAGNVTVQKILTQLCRPLFAYLMVFLSSSHKDLRTGFRSHQILLDVLRDGKQEEVRAAVREHLVGSWFEYLHEHRRSVEVAYIAI
jgi:DNA-binding GntR family transcriptional regulator